MKLAAVAALAYLALCGLLALFQRSFIYFPQPRTNRDHPTLTLAVPDARIEVTTRQSQQPGALLYFGGNAEDVSWSAGELEAAFPDRDLYLMHYRGYGGSSGRPTEAALFADAVALFDLVRANHNHIVVVGRSLGGGVAVYLASKRPVSRLVLVTPFDSVLALAARSFWFVPLRWLLRDKFESVKVRARHHGADDDHRRRARRRDSAAAHRRAAAAFSAGRRGLEDRPWRRSQQHRRQPGIRAPFAKPAVRLRAASRRGGPADKSVISMTLVSPAMGAPFVPQRVGCCGSLAG